MKTFVLGLVLALVSTVASATGTSTGVVVDVATSPVLRETQVLNGASDFSQLLSRAYTPKSFADGAEFQRLLSQPVTNNGARAAVMDIAETVTAPVITLGRQAAGMCFASPVLCAAGVAAAYIAYKNWEYLPDPSGSGSSWQYPQSGVSGTQVVGCGQPNVTITGFDLAAQQRAVDASNLCNGTPGHPYARLPCTINTVPNGTSTPVVCTAVSSGGSTTQGSVTISTLTNVYRPGSQEQMASDIQSAGSNLGLTNTQGYAQLAQQVITNGYPLPIDDTATAKLATRVPTSTATSSQTNPDGSTTTTTETYSGAPSSGPVQTTQIVFNTTTTTTGPTTTTTTTTTNTTNVTNVTNGGGSPCGAPGTPDCEVKVDETATDTPLPGQPHLYDQKYPNGLLGVWQARSPALMQSSFITSVQSMFTLGTSGGTCPQWLIPLHFGRMGDFGNGDVSPPCWLWPVIALILLTTSVFVARQILFG